MKQKTIIITGASGGVGFALVDYFNKDWNVITLRKVMVDISNYSEVKEWFQSIKSDIEVLINNASVFIKKPFNEMTETEIDKIIDTNVKGTMYCTLEAMKLMKPGGRIINIGSVSGLHGIKDQSVYSASKHAIQGFSDSINQEGRVKVTTINPGGINTPLWNKDNPYNGDVVRLLKPADIVKMVDYITRLPDNIILKNVTLFPDNEWH